jgi:hypothetical protein
MQSFSEFPVLAGLKTSELTKLLYSLRIG